MFSGSPVMRKTSFPREAAACSTYSGLRIAGIIGVSSQKTRSGVRPGSVVLLVLLSGLAPPLAIGFHLSRRSSRDQLCLDSDLRDRLLARHELEEILHCSLSHAPHRLTDCRQRR